MEREERDRASTDAPGDAEGGGAEEAKVRRSEEEADAGVRPREAGSVRARKNVRTKTEEVRVPRRREEVEVERVPVEGAAGEVEGVEIGEGEEEVVMPVYEEEVVINKRVVLREEVRLRKRVVEEVEVAEVDLRKEEVEIEDRTERGLG